MNVKRYIVDSLPQAMEQIKKDLGRDAIILHTKKVKKNRVFGLFGKSQIEVIAAVDSRPMPKETATIQDHSFRKKQTEPNPVSSEVNELKQMMLKMMLNQTEPKTAYSKEVKSVYDRLILQGVNEEVASALIGQVLSESENHPESMNVYEEVKQLLVQKFSNLADNREIGLSTKIVHFVGPTGVGKTTTIAKLAAEQVIKNKKKIAFITADTYRIAAVEQLKTYAEILNSPIEVVFSLQDTQKTIEKFKHFDLIFMDTAGRNFHNEMYISELNNILIKTNQAETYLVLSLTHKYEDMLSILEQFKKVNIDKLIFTKFDETITYGSVLNILSKFPYKVSYVTDGQNVPDDIEVFNEEKMARAILGV